MSIPVQSVQLKDVTDLTVGVGDGGSQQISAIGECFAFDYRKLAEESRQVSLGWHLWLLHRVVAGLWDERKRGKAYVCYTLHPNVTRVFFCSRPVRHPAKFWKAMSESSAYIECGRDSFPPGFARSLAYWEPPCTVMALWPPGLAGETKGARVVDTGNAMSYFSYPESDHERGTPVEEAGSEYIRLPQDEHAEFRMGDQIYRYQNRWAAVEMELSTR